MIFSTVFRGRALSEAWHDAHPDSKANNDSAKGMARREIDWYRKNHPIAMNQLLHLHKLGNDELIGQLKEQLSATMSLKAGSVKTSYKDDNGQLVTDEQFSYTEVPDWRTRADALKKWMTLAGHEDRGRIVRPLDTDATKERITKISDPAPSRRTTGGSSSPPSKLKRRMTKSSR